MLRKIFTFTAIAVLISGCDQADIDRINDAIAHWDLSHLHELFRRIARIRMATYLMMQI